MIASRFAHEDVQVTEVQGSVAKRISLETASDDKLLAQCEKLIAAGQEDSFVVVDLGIVKQQLARWQQNLPGVVPWYAIKCHPDAELMKELFSGGCGFDAASIAEMQSALTLGCSPDNIIFANPCKQPSHIRFAYEHGICLMTFDNIEELRKIKKYHPSARLVMRILGDDSSSLCKFNAKFGISVEDSVPLLREAKRIGSEIVGISFHVGSGCRSADAFVGALENARRAFDLLIRFGFKPQVLDLGGGWPGSLPGCEEADEIGFEEIASKVRPAMARLFADFESLLVIAEPGRYFAHACAAAVVSVTSKRAVASDMPSLAGAYSGDDDTDHETDHEETDVGVLGYRYYVNDGVYSTFNCVICDHREKVEPSFFLNEDGKTADFDRAARFPCSIWGNSCDGIDKISASVELPNMPIGTWLVFKNMGAYTTSAASAGFNGFPIAKKYYL